MLSDFWISGFRNKQWIFPLSLSLFWSAVIEAESQTKAASMLPSSWVTSSDPLYPLLLLTLAPKPPSNSKKPAFYFNSSSPSSLFYCFFLTLTPLSLIPMLSLDTQRESWSEDRTRLNRCNTIYKACKFVERIVIHSMVTAHLPSELGPVFTPTHTVHKVRGDSQWDCRMTLGHVCKWRLGYSHIRISHIKYITVSHHKNQIAFPDHSFFFTSLHLHHPICLPPLHIMYNSQKSSGSSPSILSFLCPDPSPVCRL